jgi:hypothetical protein
MEGIPLPSSPCSTQPQDLPRMWTRWYQRFRGPRPVQIQDPGLGPQQLWCQRTHRYLRPWFRKGLGYAPSPPIQWMLSLRDPGGQGSGPALNQL